MDGDSVGLGLELFRTATGQLNQIWTFYSIVALGIIGLVYREQLGDTMPARVSLTAGFLLLAGGNLHAVWRHASLVQRVVVELRAAPQATAEGVPTPLRSVLHSMSATDPAAVVAFHLLLDVCVLAAIWWPTVRGQVASRRTRS